MKITNKLHREQTVKPLYPDLPARDSNNKQQVEEITKVSDVSPEKSSKTSGLAATQSTSTPSSLTDENYFASKETQRLRIESLKAILRVRYKLQENEIKSILDSDDNRHKMIFISLDKEEWNTDVAAQMLNFFYADTKQSTGTGSSVLNRS